MTQQSTSLQALRSPAESGMPAVTPGFGSLQSFELMQRAAKLLSSSTLVPAAYRQTIEKLDRYGNVKESRENPNALANAVVALNMAQRMGADPLMVMQNLYIVEGRPSWSSQWIIAAINGCGRFSPLRFRIENRGKRTVEYRSTFWENGQRQSKVEKVTIEDKVCVAWAIEKETGEHIESPAVSIEMAVKEGWYTKTGSKWQTMDEVMLRYRTASFFGKLYAPELLMGLQTVEEAQDIIEATTAPDGTIHVDVDGLRSQQENQPARRPWRNGPDGAVVVEDVEETAAGKAQVDPETGEVLDEPTDGAARHAAADVSEEPTYDQVAHQLRAAKSMDTLDIAADLIQDVGHPEDQEDLRVIYQQRREELDAPQQQPRRTRRAMNVE